MLFDIILRVPVCTCLTTRRKYLIRDGNKSWRASEKRWRILIWKVHKRGGKVVLFCVLGEPWKHDSNCESLGWKKKTRNYQFWSFSNIFWIKFATMDSMSRAASTCMTSSLIWLSFTLKSFSIMKSRKSLLIKGNLREINNKSNGKR